jgi:hypothetical protein
MVSEEDFFEADLKSINLVKLHKWLNSFGLKEENNFQLILSKNDLKPVSRVEFHKSNMLLPCYRFGATFDFPKSFSALKYQLDYIEDKKQYSYFGKIWLISNQCPSDSNWKGFQFGGVRFLEPHKFDSIEAGISAIN